MPGNPAEPPKYPELKRELDPPTEQWLENARAATITPATYLDLLQRIGLYEFQQRQFIDALDNLSYRLDALERHVAARTRVTDEWREHTEQALGALRGAHDLLRQRVVKKNAK